VTHGLKTRHIVIVNLYSASSGEAPQRHISYVLLVFHSIIFYTASASKYFLQN